MEHMQEWWQFAFYTASAIVAGGLAACYGVWKFLHRQHLFASIEKIEKHEHGLPPLSIDFKPVLDAAFAMQKAATDISKDLLEYAERLENYHMRTGNLEAAKINFEARIHALERLVDNLEKSEENQWSHINTNKQDLAELRGRFDGRFGKP
jgi:hypothetical protein